MEPIKRGSSEDTIERLQRCSAIAAGTLAPLPTDNCLPLVDEVKPTSTPPSAAQSVNPSTDFNTLPQAASRLNPGVFETALLEIAQVYDQAQNAIADQLRMAMTPADVTRMQVHTDITNQLKAAIEKPATANQAATEQIEAQVAGNIAAIGEAALPQNVDDDTKRLRQWLVDNANYTPEQAAQQIIAGPKENLRAVDEEFLNAKNSLVKDANGVEHPKYAPARLLPLFITDDQRFAQCTLPYKPVRGSQFGNVFCEWQDEPQQPKEPEKQPPADNLPPQPAPQQTSGECIKVEICNWPNEKTQSKPEEKEDKACKKWKLYKTKDGICYVVPSDQSPKSSEDSLQTEGEFSQDWFDRIVSQCGKKTNEPSKPKDEKGQALEFKTDSTCIDSIAATGVLSIQSADDIKKFLGISDSAFDAISSTSWKDLFTGPLLPTKVAIKVILSQLWDMFAPTIDGFVKNTDCNQANPSFETWTLIVLNFIKYITGNALSPTEQALEYQRNEKCPFLLPSSAEALQSYLSNQTDLERLECIVKANGQIWNEFQPAIQANRTKHSSLDLASLFRRKVINREEYDNRIRELGYLRSQDGGEILRLTEQLPGPQDIIRLMVRDAANEDVVKTFDLDTGFEANFAGKLKEWADNQGVPQEVMKYLWRAHWDIPSPTQLYEMYRRLRHSTIYNPLGTLEQDVKKALVQQDIAPFWIDRLLALSFNPLTRTDARRAFEIGSINETELWNSFIDSGYTDENATRLVDFAKKQLQLKYYRHPLVSQYARGAITGADLEAALAFEGAKPDQIDLAKSRARTIARMDSRKACAKSVKRRFFLGDLDEFELVPKLTQLGLDDDMASIIASGWICERSARGKTLPAMRLAKLFQAGVIDEAKYVKNLIGIGYTGETALDLLAEQRGIMDETKRKKKEAEAKKAAAEAEKKKRKNEAEAKLKAKQAKDEQKQEADQVKDAIKQAKAAEAAAEKLANAQQKGLKAIQDRANKLRNIQLDIAVNISKKTGEYLGDVLNRIEGYVRTRKAGGIDPMAFAECGLAASKTFNGKNAEDFFPRWDSCWQSPAISSPILA